MNDQSVRSIGLGVGFLDGWPGAKKVVVVVVSSR